MRGIDKPKGRMVKIIGNDKKLRNPKNIANEKGHQMIIQGQGIE